MWCRSPRLLNSFLFRLLVCLGMLLAPESLWAATCASVNIPVAQKSHPLSGSVYLFYVDHSPPGSHPAVTNSYVAYQITNNTGSALSDVWVKLENFTGAKIELAGNETGIYHVGPLANGASSNVYFFLKSTASSGANQKHDVTVYNGNPSAVASTCATNFNYTITNEQLASANKVDATFVYPVLPSVPEVGAQAQLGVQGNTGTIGAAGIFQANPAGLNSWPANVFVLYDVSTVFYSPGTTTVVSTVNDTLLPSVPSTGTNYDYVVTYYFKVQGTTTSDTTVFPVNFISSGAQIKYVTPDLNDLTNQTLFPPIPPPQNYVVLSASVSPTSFSSGGTATYTITITNNGTSSVTLDDLSATLPTSPASITYVNGTSAYDGGSIANPSISGNVLTWYGLFTIPVGGSKSLTFNASVPNTSGIYTATFIGHLGTTVIDTTQNNLSDSSAASAIVTVGSGSISGRVWSDDDSSGTQNGLEAGLQNVTLTIYKDDGDSTYDPGAGQDGSPLVVATTNASGDYSFPNLPNGSYWVVVTDTNNVVSSMTLTAGSTPRLVTVSGSAVTGRNLGYVVDACPLDPLKTSAGACGCGVADTDTDSDGTADCNESCDTDPLKTAPGICGCGVADTDSDSDGALDCNESCDTDPLKTAPGICGCGVAETGDSDSDGTADCNETCDNDPLKTAPGVCGCGVADVDSDSDGTLDCNETCDNDPFKTAPGVCGCGVAETGDSDSDGTADCNETCDNDPLKAAPGQCGCGNPDADADSDGTADCLDLCPNDPLKVAVGACGCNVADTDGDNDSTPDCVDACPADAQKIAAGICGCGVVDDSTDTDGDTIPDCKETDTDGDGVPDASEGNTDSDGDGIPNYKDLDSDDDGIPDSVEGESDADGDGIPNYLDLDSDFDGIPDVIEAGGSDTNGDGRLDTSTDADHDGLLDLVDPDQGGTALPLPDTDGDGHKNFLDIDADGDGIVDTVEAQAEGTTPRMPSGSDADQDGLDDAYDPTTGGTSLNPTDTDKNGVPDYLSLDSDGDGAPDSVEGHDANRDGIPDHKAMGTDTDGDGLDDGFDNFVLVPSGSSANLIGSNSPLQNSDADAARDWRDTDDDNDGILTSIELGSVPGRALDSDGDGIPDYLEIGATCQGSSITPTSFTMDGAAHALEAAVNSAISVRARSKSCDALKTASARRARTQANALYVQVWQLVWTSYPLTSYSCTGSVAPSCVSVATGNYKNSIQTSSQDLRSLVGRTLGSCARKTKAGKKLLRSADAQLSSITTALTSVPDPLLYCP